MSSTKIKVVKNLYWAVLGKVVTLFGSLLVGIFVARYLGPEQYGLMNYVISYVSLFQVLATFGLDNIEIREESKANEQKNSIIGTAFAIKCFFSLITMGLVIGTAFIFEADTFTKWMIILYSFSVILNSFTVIRNYFTSIVWNEYIVKTEISRTLIGAVVKIVLLLMHASLAWFIAATLFDCVLIASGYCLSYATKIGKIRDWKFDKVWAKYLIKQSFPLLLTSAAVIIYQRIDQVMIGNMIDKAAVGQFSVALRFAEMIVFIPTIMSQTISPILVRTREQNLLEYERKAQMFMNVTVWGCFLVSILVSIISYWLILYTFGAEYLPAVGVLQILSFKATSMALSTTAGQMLIIEGLQKYAIFRDAFGCLVCIGLNLLLIPKYGIMGAAVVAILSSLASGYVADLFIPKYRHLFRRQTRTLFLGWKDLVHIKMILKK